MKIETLYLPGAAAINDEFPLNACILDIETKGRINRKGPLAFVALIERTRAGDLMYTWEAETSADEYLILSGLASVLSPLKTLITYNGRAFDIPVLKTKYENAGLPSPFFSKTFRDLYLEDKELVSVFALPSRKLRDFSLVLPPMAENGMRTDAELTRDLLSLTSVFQLFDRNYTINSALRDEDHLYYTLAVEKTFPGHLSISDGIYHVILAQKEIRLSVQITDGRVRRYYTDIKHYVYLPNEGYSIHKSMADLVEKKHKEKAVRENCFSLVLVTDRFLTDEAFIKNYLASVFSWLRTR